MKWGKRKAKAVAWGKEFGKAYANAYLHPTHMVAAGNKLAFKNGKNGALKYSVLQGSTNALGYKNKVVKDRLAAKKIYKEDKKNSDGKNAQKIISAGKKAENFIDKSGNIKRNLDLKDIAQGIAAANDTGLFKYDNPTNPTRRDYAQFLARDTRTLSKMSRKLTATKS
jgi:hypothetical protein